MAMLSCLCTQCICRESAGGGLPEMKTILSGVVKPILLSKRLIVAKISGLVFALLAGLSVGKEGPFVHASAAMADQLMRLPMFQHIRTQDAKRLEIMACACASGVSGSFGTAFGGVLFSIEFTASAYSVRTLPKAFLTSSVAMVVVFMFGASDQLSLFNANRSNSSWMPYSHEMLAFVVIGVLCGLLGVFFVYIVECLTFCRNWLLDSKRLSPLAIDRRRMGLVSMVTLILSTLMYFELASIPEVPRLLIDYMFEQESLKHLLPKLMLYFPYKFLVTALSVTLPLPVGLFTPVFMTGSVLGRIIGETISGWRVFIEFANYSPSDYSILAAAAFSTGVTRAISTAVIVYELSGEPHLRLPLSIVILTAYFVGNRFSKNIYDALIDQNGTPYMQEIPKDMLTVPAAEVMVPINERHVLELNSTYRDALSLLEATSFSMPPSKVADSIEDCHSLSKNTSSSTRDGLETSLKASSFSSQADQRAEDAGVQLSCLAPAPFSSSERRSGFLPSYGSTSNGSDVHVLNEESLHVFRGSVIPVVQSRKSMVIVGAVLREDVKVNA